MTSIAISCRSQYVMALLHSLVPCRWLQQLLECRCGWYRMRPMRRLADRDAPHWRAITSMQLHCTGRASKVASRMHLASRLRSAGCVRGVRVACTP